jgi:hypothetical protein
MGGDAELRGPGSETWNEQERQGRGLEDLLSLAPLSEEVSGFSVLSSRPVSRALERLPGELVSISEYGYGSGIRRIGTAQTWVDVGDQLSTVAAAILILVPVIVLHFLKTANQRLGSIVAFTLLFAFMLGKLAGANRNEVFAATAGFVAVQVVYVGSALSPSDTSVG